MSSAKTQGGNFTVEGLTRGEMRKRWRAAHKEARLGAAQHVVAYWWGRMMRRHFEPSAVNRYGYKKREKKYQIRKARKKRHQNPLVWTGNFKRLMEMMLPPVKFVKDEIVARWTGMPRYIYYTSSIAAGHRPDIRAEVTTVAGDEEPILINQFERRYSRLMGDQIAA